MLRFMMRTISLAIWCFSMTAAHAADSILIFGDSLSAGYGIATDVAWPKLLQAQLRAQGYDDEVVNASISGETTAGGRERLEPLLKQHVPRVVILELGGNDGLRGLPLSAMESNLTAMIKQAQAAGAKVLLAGMRLPPNYGPYAKAFHSIYIKVARREETALLPFLLEGIGGHDELMQEDGMHPRAAAQPRIVDNIWPVLKPLLKK